MSSLPIGRDELRRLVEDLNNQRASHGVRRRYYTIEIGGVLTMAEEKTDRQTEMFR